jgi:photosystem II stability/assembly factor-like uncharacterized protein
MGYLLFFILHQTLTPLGVYEWNSYGPQYSFGSGLGVTRIATRLDGTPYLINDHCGIFKSETQGEFWYHCNNPLYSLDSSANILYAIAPTSGPYPIIFIGGYNFIYKTTNGGDSWFRADSGVVGYGIAIDINTIAVHPAYYYGAIAYAGGHCYYPPPQEGGHLYKTTNGGRSWQDVTGSLPYFYGVNCIALRRDNLNLAFVSLSGAGIYKTTDQGNTWTQKSYLCPNDIKISPFDSLLIFAAADDGLYRSTNGGEYWLPCALGGIRCYDIEFDTLNPGVVYVASDSGVYKSTNNGSSWFQTLFANRATQIVIFGFNKLYCSGGDANTIYRSLDGGNTWEKKDCGLYASYIRKIGIDCEDKNLVYAAATARGLKMFKSNNGGATWVGLSNAPNSISAIRTHPTLTKNLWATIDSGCVFYSSDAGENWQQIGFIPAVLTDIYVSHHSPSLIYVSGWYIIPWVYHGVLYRSRDGGYSWECVLDLPNSTCDAVIIDPLDDNIIYACGAGSFGVQKSTDGGNTWIGLGLENYGNCALAVNPLNNNEIYVGSANQYLSEWYGLQRSTDGGLTWIQTPITEQIWTVEVDPITGWVYAGGGSDDEPQSNPGKVYFSQDHGESWSELTHGFNPLLRFCAIKDIEIFSGGYRLYCGTSEMGVWEYTWPTSIEEQTKNQNVKRGIYQLKISPNPFFLQCNIALYGHNLMGKATIIQIYDATGRLVRQFNHLTNYQSSIIWDGTDDSGRRLPAGIYFVRVESDEFKETEKVILLR